MRADTILIISLVALVLVLLCGLVGTDWADGGKGKQDERLDD